MPIESIVVLALIVSAFTTFGCVLAYGESQTRDFKRPGEAVTTPQDNDPRWQKAA